MDQPLAMPVASQRILPRVRQYGLTLLSMNLPCLHQRESLRRTSSTSKGAILGSCHSQNGSTIYLLPVQRMLLRNRPMLHPFHSCCRIELVEARKTPRQAERNNGRIQ